MERGGKCMRGWESGFSENVPKKYMYSTNSDLEFSEISSCVCNVEALSHWVHYIERKRVQSREG